MTLPDLVIRGVPYGTHETPRDLRLFLYRGGAELGLKGLRAIDDGSLSPALPQRLPLVIAIHTQLADVVAGGGSKSSLRSSWDHLLLCFDCF